MRCCRSAWPEAQRPGPPAAAESWGRSVESSGRFLAPMCRGENCRPVRLSRAASRARSPTRSSEGWLPISANRWAARSAVRVGVHWCAARSAGCCDDKVFYPPILHLLQRGLPLIFRKGACAEISVVASAARYPLSGLLYRADRRRARSGDLGERKDQGLSALVLGRPAGPPRQGALSQRSQSLFRIHLSAVVGGLARDTQLFRQDTSLCLPVGPQRGRVVDDGSILERDDGIGADTRPVAVCAAGLRDGYLCLRHVRSRAAEPCSAGHDAVRVLAVAAQAAVERGQHVCAGYRDQGFPGGGVPLSRLAKAVGIGCEHGHLPGRFSIRGAGAGARFPAQRFRTEDLVSGNGWIEFGAGVRT